MHADHPSHGNGENAVVVVGSGVLIMEIEGFLTSGWLLLLRLFTTIHINSSFALGPLRTGSSTLHVILGPTVHILNMYL